MLKINQPKLGLWRLAGVMALTSLGLAGCSEGQHDAPVPVAPAAQRLAYTVTANPDLPPTTAQTACTNEADFYPADGTFDSNALINRHVLCVKDSTDFDVDLKDSAGEIFRNGAKVYLEAFWSISGPSNGLNKKEALLKVKYTVVMATVPSGSPALVAPTIKVTPRFECTGESGMAVTCDKTLPTFSFSRTGIWTNPSTGRAFTVDWDKNIAKEIHTSVNMVMDYSTDGSAPIKNTGNSWEPKFSSWVMRCDSYLASSDTEGCVFDDASAVWDFSVAGNGPQTQAHMAYALANFPQIPGKFRLQQGKRSVALDDPGSNYQGLTYADAYTANGNRAAASRRCDVVYGATRKTACPSGGSCDCDEYPPATAMEGAKSVESDPAKYSVRMLDEGDNRSAGRQLAIALTRERIYKEKVDKFWVYLGNAPTTPPPPPPPPPPPVVVTTQLKITELPTTDLGGGRTQYRYQISNEGTKDIVGPFRLYYTGLDARVQLEPNCRNLEGRKFVDIGHASIGSQITVFAGTTATAPPGVPLNMKFELVAGNGTGSCAWDSFDPRVPPIPAD